MYDDLINSLKDLENEEDVSTGSTNDCTLEEVLDMFEKRPVGHLLRYSDGTKKRFRFDD